ncbi:MAG: calcium/sodium antiporter [Chitinivibrionales bacterium]|nr:calcium/sodium antiporter [Chitinivibrionales bacterium]MBD3394483.1 calcium/sodium antiporter [Chitinivibrionales bacterium]
MQAVHAFIEGNIVAAWVVLFAAFAVLAKCADLFVTASVSLAFKLRVPKLVVGIILVSLATTAPELSVSLLSALQGKPEMALGNAIGSVICDDGLALALAGLFSAAPIMILPAVFRSSAIFLIAIDIIAFLFVVFDNTLNRLEGAVLVTLFIGYLVFLYRQGRSGALKEATDAERIEGFVESALPKAIMLFVASLAGIIFASEFIITSATTIALFFAVPESIIALTLVALGTSIPEVATCVAAARKREGAIAVGNILGADIMNVCWVAGASAMANDLVLGRREILFMFPAMFIIVGAMLIMLRAGYSLTRTKGLVLFGLYILYLISFFIVFPPG